MDLKFVALSFRVLLAYAVAFAPVVHGAENRSPDTPPPTQTGDGGGGKKPPNLPEILFAGPGGDSDHGKNGRGKGGAQGDGETRTGGFGRLWGIDNQGREIYYEGALDGQNRIRVWQHEENNVRYVRRGVVEPKPGTDGVVKWQSADTFINLHKERSGFVGFNSGNTDGKAGEVWGRDVNNREITHEGWRDAFGKIRVRQWTGDNRYMFRRGWVEEIPARVKGEHSGLYTVRWEKGHFRERGGTLESISGNLLDSFQAKSVDKKGRAVLETVYFEGRRNAQGLETVFRPDTSAGALNPDLIREGVLNADNTVTWNEGTRTRMALVNELKNLDLAKSSLTEDQKAKFRENIRLLTEVSKAAPTARRLLYPNYAEAAGSKAPLPSNRSLVPIEESKDLINSRSGRSEGNSRSIEYFKTPQFAPEDRPSNLEQKLEWTSAKSRRLARMLKDWSTGATDTVHAKWNTPAKTYEQRFNNPSSAPSNAAEFSNGAFTFYAALGVAAAYTLMTDYSNNPNAWSSYLESLQDPVGWAALSGFIIAGAPFYKMMNGPGARGKVMRQIPLFSAGLLAGALAATSISKFARDEDVRQCLGFVAYPMTGKFQHDTAACDKAYNHWLTDEGLANKLAEIGNDFLPTAATIVTAGAAYMGLIEGGKFLISRTGLLNSLRNIPIMKTPRGGALISLGVGVAQVSLFLGAYYIAGTTFEIEKSIKDWEITNFNFNSNMMLLPLWFVPGKQKFVFNKVSELIQQTGPVPAQTLKEAEIQLLNEWSRVKQNGWKNPYSWKNVCYDPHRVYQQIYNCDAPDTLDFEGTLDKYAAFMRQWRANQLSDTLESYKEWMKKVNDYQTQVDTAHSFYKQVVTSVQNGRFDAKDLNLSKVGTPSGSGPIWSKDYSGVWKYVDTPKQQDFLLTSMACGPEAEGYGGAAGFWGSTKNFLKNWVTFNSHPEDIVKNPSGSEIQFYPPRVTVPNAAASSWNPLTSTNTTICEMAPGLASPTDVIGHPRYSPLDFPAYNEQKYYRGLVDYIRENLRASVLSGGENNFEAWWSKYVSEEINKIEPILRADYKKMLDTTFNKALTRHDYVSGWCEPSANKTTGLEKYLRRLGNGQEKCPPEALHRLAYGVLDSMHDEMRLYLALLADLYISNGGANAGADRDAAVMSRAKSLLEEFDKVLSELPKTDPSQRKVEEAFKRGNEAWNELAKLFVNSADADFEKGAYQSRWALKLIDKSKDLFTTYMTYYKILTTFEPADGP